MSDHQDIVNIFDKSIVKIIANHGTSIGTGFIVTDDCIICTCHHVIGDLDSKKVYDAPIQVYFPQTKRTISATILVSEETENKEQYLDPINDITFLKLSEDDQK